MNNDIDEDTVDFAPNYDGQEQEPQVLPAAFPNLLVNGTAGIAVGMATNMPPHNLGEVVAAARHLIKRPEATLEELVRIVPGPDLPTGGRIVGLNGVRDAYESGRGVFRMRATVHVEAIGRRQGIVVTELPYNIGPEKVISKIKELVQAKKVQGIADLKDLTDRTNGLRIVIEVKNGFNPDAILAQLYKLTPLEESFGINNVALVDGQPLTLGLKELLEVYLDHRFEVVRRRSEFRRKKRQDRMHLVEGLMIALLNIDAVIATIRESENTADARRRLMEQFSLTEVQANYILDTPLRRLTKFDRLELENEQERLRAEIAELSAILESDTLLRKVVSDELAKVSKEYATPRRSAALGDRRDHAGRAGRGDLGRAAVPSGRGGHPAAAGGRGRTGGRHLRARAGAQPAGGREGAVRDQPEPGIAGRGAGHGTGRGQAGRAGIPGEQGHDGGDHAQGRRPDRRRGGAAHRPRGSRVHHLGRAAAEVLGRTGASAGQAGGRHGRNQAGRRRDRAVVRGGGPGQGRGRGLGRGQRRHAARRDAEHDQGHAVPPLPVEGPCDRRRALPAVPEGRGPAGVRLGRRVPGASGGRRGPPRSRARI